MPNRGLKTSTSSLRRGALVVGLIGGVGTAIVAVANASKVAEPYWIATRGFVADEIRLASDQHREAVDKMMRRQIRTQLSISSANRQRIEADIAGKDLILKQQTALPQEVRNIIEEQLRALKRDLNDSDRELGQLRGELASQRQ